MASARFEKGSEEFQLFQDLWIVVQKHYIPEENDDYWQLVIADVNEFLKKYEKNNGLLSRKLGVAFMDYLEAKYKEGKKTQI